MGQAFYTPLDDVDAGASHSVDPSAPFDTHQLSHSRWAAASMAARALARLTIAGNRQAVDR
eukprot:1547106-Prymnesium_polylepis.1